MVTLSVTTPLALLHLFVASANAIVSFSLLVYVLTRTPRNTTTLTFIMVSGLATAMWVGEAGHISVRNNQPEALEEAIFWLRVQAVGLALLPAAYLHVSDILLRSTGSLSTSRRAAVVTAFAVGAGWLVLLLGTDLVIAGPALTVWGTHFRPGVLYPAFVLYAGVLSLWSLYGFFRARHRCLTASLRRRMGYLAFSFIMPGLGFIPYLLSASALERLPDVVLILLPLAGSLGVTPMIVVLAYIASYQGVLLPDRVVKQRLVYYLLRGPFLGVAVTFLVITVPRLGRIMALFSDRFQVFAVVFVIVVLQALLDYIRPWIDRIISQDEEIAWLEELNQRLLTSADLRELLNNTVIAVCEVLRVRSGFIVAPERDAGEFVIQAVVGSEARARDFLAAYDARALTSRAQQSLGEHDNGGVVTEGGYWLFALAASGEGVGGLLAAAKQTERPDLSAAELEIIEVLVDRASLAVEDIQLQRRVLDTLKGVAPEIVQVQQWGSQLRFATPSTLSQLEADPLYGPEFYGAVRDALSHYWGGPKLTNNPLLALTAVQAAMTENNNNPGQALRAVLRQLVETLRPPDERDQMATEWILYNILRLRFLQGKRVKEIVQELVMSESDFYRKERAAIREVARALATLEKSHVKGQELPSR